MFKRLFLLSGVVAFLLACATMFFWYLPREKAKKSLNKELNQSQLDSVSVIKTDSVVE